MRRCLIHFVARVLTVPVYRQSKEADAALYQRQRETEGMLEMAKGYSALIDVFGGAQSFMQYRMMENGTYEKLAKANGMAISGLQPKISTWNTGRFSVVSSSHGIDNWARERKRIRRFNGSCPRCHAESPSASRDNP
jgi:hypothetical protein